MISVYILSAVAIFLIVLGFNQLVDSGRISALNRLFNLNTTSLEPEREELDWNSNNDSTKKLKDRLGKAGFISANERRQAKIIQSLIISISMFICIYFIYDPKHVLNTKAFILLGLGAIGGLYLGFILWMFFLRHKEAEFNRKVLYQLPIALESIILLVDSGLGILPAIETLVSKAKNQQQDNQVYQLFEIVYDLCSHGMPFEQALERVAYATEIRGFRHVLLHLDVSSNEGGELIPSLRSLSKHAHTEWKLSVETRVRRLENFVVFPVFASVIGLILISAAVPIVPVFEFRDKINANKMVPGLSKNDGELLGNK